MVADGNREDDESRDYHVSAREGRDRAERALTASNDDRLWPSAVRRDFLKGTLAALAVPSALGAPASAAGETGWEAESIRDGDGIVSASNPIAAEEGADVLRNGGNAFDAAAMVQLVLTVVDPYGSGIGGSAMATAYSTDDERAYALNAQARAPIDASVGIRYDENGDLKPRFELFYGGITVGTPGTLRGLDLMLKHWGTKSLRDLASAPAALAEEGFEVDEYVASVASATAWRMNEAAREIWAPDGEPVEAGDVIVQEDLAKTFRLIETDGLRPFYRGEIAEAIADAVQEWGGVMRVEDLKAYRPTIDRPTQTRYEDPHPTVANNRPVDILSIPAPGEGGTIVPAAMKILDRIDLSETDPLSAERYHLTWEARAAMNDPVVGTMGDPEFVDVPRGILDGEFLTGRRELIDRTTRNPNILNEPSDPWAYQAGEPWTTDPPVDVSEDDVVAEAELPETEHTTHFSVADGDGNVVSFTGTLSSGFGTGNVVPGYGFFLNNSIGSGLGYSGPNKIGPLRRYRTTTAPSLVLRGGKPLFACGSPGGSSISQTVIDVLLNLIEYGMTLEAAVEHPRMYIYTDELEAGLPEETLQGLRDLGYETSPEPTTRAVGDTQMVAVDQERDELVGVFDPRRGGGVVGAGDDAIKREPRL